MNPRLSRRLRLRTPIQHQHGAALLVSLMILIILSLLAISASQVTSLQEKMVQAYWSDVRAFEAAEERLRVRERTLRRLAETEECPVLDDTGPLPDWVNPNLKPTAIGNHSAMLGSGPWARGAGMPRSNRGGPRLAVDCPYYMLSASDTDTRDAADANAWAVVQSIFVP
jgi:type IV pilus assembly protein PilX